MGLLYLLPLFLTKLDKIHVFTNRRYYPIIIINVGVTLFYWLVVFIISTT